MYCILHMTPSDVWVALLEASFEDVGLCDPYAAVEAQASYEEWLGYEGRREHGVSQAVLLRAGLFLSRAPKSRLVDNCKVVHLVHLEPEIGEEDKTVSLDPFRGARLDTYRLSEPEPWPVRQSMVCVARGIVERDTNRAIKSAVRLHVWGKGHLVWALIKSLQDRHEGHFGWARVCTDSYARAWKFLVSYGTPASPADRGLAAVVQGVLLLPFRHNVPHEARTSPWGVCTRIAPSGRPEQFAPKRSDMPYWLEMAQGICAKMEGRKRRPMPESALNMTTRQGRDLGRGVAHFYQNSAVITNVPLHPPDDEFRVAAEAELLAIEQQMPLRDGLRTLVNTRRLLLDQGLGTQSPSRTPSPCLLPGSTTSSLDEIPSSPESPAKKRRLHGGVVFPKGVSHRWGSDKLRWIVRIDPPRLAPTLLCNSLRRLLAVPDRPPFCPRVLQIATRKDKRRGALVGAPWNEPDQFQRLVPIGPTSGACLATLGCLAFRFVFEVRGGLDLRDADNPGTPIHSFGERAVMDGPPSASFSGGWRDFLSSADNSGALDAATEAVGLWKQILTRHSEKVIKTLGMEPFVRVMGHAETLLSKDGWLSEAFLCTIGK